MALAVPAENPAAFAARPPPLAPFLAVFFLSGFAALLYQMVWQRLLTFFGGADVRSVTIIVSAFMAGLGCGSLAGGHLADRLAVRGRFLAFAVCELAVALFGFASVPLYYDVLYVRLGPVAIPEWGVAVVVFLTLLWPTFFMGASLPLLARALTDRAERAGEKIGALYGWNTFGAAVGSLLSVWVLVRALGFGPTVQVGAVLNLFCAGAALLLGPRYWRTTEDGRPLAPDHPVPAAAPPTSFRLSTWIALYALSGFVALSLEILWFRVLGVVLKSNSFTFATLLASYLSGLGLGALIGGKLAGRSRSPAAVFLGLQSAIPLYAGASMALLVAILDHGKWLPRVRRHVGGYEAIPIDDAVRALRQWWPGTGAVDPAGRELANLFLDLHVWLPLALIVPPTLLMGLSFAFLQQATQTDVAFLGRRVGWLQTANIAGSTLGAVLTGVFLLDWLGSSWTLRLLVALGGAFLIPLALGAGRRRRLVLSVGAAATMAVVALVPPPAALWARLHGTTPERIVFAEDGSGVSVLRNEGTATSRLTTVFVSGLGQSKIPYGSYHTLLGALPVLLHPDPAEVAVIGLGSGDTAFGIGGRPETRRIDCIEIVACQLPTLRTLARREPYAGLRVLLLDPRVRHVAGDGRAFLMRGGRYDVIEADALRPTSAYAGNLYSREYFALLGRHLKPGGLAVTWSPTSRTRDTFLSVFPHVLVFGDGETLVGSRDPIAFDPETVGARLRDARFTGHYRRGGLDIVALLSPTLAKGVVAYGPASGRAATSDVNTDLFPRDEYLVPRARQR